MKIYRIWEVNKNSREMGLLGVLAIVLNFNILLNEFELQLRYHDKFRTTVLW